jgi:MFS transporter, BCD family, chlorophyll transporter
MKESNLSSVPLARSTALPSINVWTMFRLGLFQMGLGIMSLLTLGVLNRIMIDELKVLPIVAALAIAMHQFVSPARVWFGQLSDSKPLLGMHRTGYVWLGAAGFTMLSFIALQAVWQLGLSLQSNGWSSTTYAWASLLGLIFGAYGLTLSASSTPFAALLVDVTDEDNRSRLVGVVWSMLMVGIVFGAVVSSKLLETEPSAGAIVNIPQLQATVNPVFMAMPAFVFCLCLAATVGVENKYSRYRHRSILAGREEEITLGKALRVLTASRQTGLFFSFLLVMTISVFMYDVVLEPYGGEVFNLSIAETTALNAPFGVGTLIGIATTGFFVVPRLGKQQTTRLGCMATAISCILLALSGFTANPLFLRLSFLLFGYSTGIITAGATSLMLDLTAAETAGTFIGAWGLAQAMSRGLATVVGGLILDISKRIFTLPTLTYGTVFVVQALGLLLAIWFLGRVNVKEFQDNAKVAVATVLAGELDG